MPSGNLTNANVGIAVPLCYGFIRVTGNQSAFITLPATTDADPQPNPLLQVAFYLGGEGEWDGCDALFINGNRMFAYDTNGDFIGPNPAEGTIPVGGPSEDTSPLVGTLFAFNFHPGVDAALLGDAPVPEQDIDALWNMFGGL